MGYLLLGTDIDRMYTFFLEEKLYLIRFLGIILFYIIILFL